LQGPRERIEERLGAWHQCGVTTIIVRAHEPASLRALAELVL
jgi:hypothetical protein